MKNFRFTKKGYEDLKRKYQDLLTKRPEAVEHLKKSRELGDLSENGYYKSSRAKLSFIDRQLRELSFSLKNATIVASTQTHTVNIGSTVILQSSGEDLKFEIVGDLEADPASHKISLLSPLGKALTGRSVGELVEFESPSGKISYRIKSISVL